MYFLKKQRTMQLSLGNRDVGASGFAPAWCYHEAASSRSDQSHRRGSPECRRAWDDSERMAWRVTWQTYSKHGPFSLDLFKNMFALFVDAVDVFKVLSYSVRTLAVLLDTWSFWLPKCFDLNKCWVSETSRRYLGGKSQRISPTVSRGRTQPSVRQNPEVEEAEEEELSIDQTDDDGDVAAEPPEKRPRMQPDWRFFWGGAYLTVQEPLAKKGGENEKRQEEVGRYVV